MKKKFFNAKFYRNGTATEMVVEDGKITQIGTNLPKGEEEIDLNGKLVLPPYVDPHLHLDYVYTGRNDGGKIKIRNAFRRYHPLA